MAHEGGVRIAATALREPAAAIKAIFDELDPSTLAGIILFCSSRYCLADIAKALAKQPGNATVVGCTTAGEIGPQGARSGTMLAVGFPSSDFALDAVRFDGLDDFDSVMASGLADSVAKTNSLVTKEAGEEISKVAMLLIDGLSHREEFVASALQTILWPIRLIGASAADDMAFRRTYVLHQGQFRCDCAILAVLSSRRPLWAFRATFHAPQPSLAVVTRANPIQRRVYELNGEPAAQEYARLVGRSKNDLTPEVYAAHPLVVKVAGEYFARSIQRTLEDDSLVLHSAIDRGVVARVGRDLEILQTLRDTLAGVRQDVEDIDTIIAFESVLNRILAVKAGVGAALTEIYANSRMVGFHTYGEQFTDVHLNQNLVGLIVGRSPHAR